MIASRHPLIVMVSLLIPLSAAALDLDLDGLCDVWQARFHAFALDPDGDEDGDGATNAEEAVAGTDPFDPTSVFRARIGTLGENEVLVDFPTQPGKAYQIYSATSLAGPWIPRQNPAPRTAGTAFYQVRVSDQDSDGDGLSDWAELQLEGFDPHLADSFGPGTPGDDLAVATGILKALGDGSVSMTIDAPAAYEKDQLPGIVTYSRTTDTSHPFTLFLKTSGATDPSKSSASSADFSLQDLGGTTLTHKLVIPAGASSAQLRIVPATNEKPEVPRELVISVSGADIDAKLSIRDAEPIPANQRLFVAYLRPAPGTASLGSGIATALVPGDHDTATVALSFSNLNSPVNSTQVQTIDSAILQSVPPFAYGGQSWPIRASQSYVTDQQVLDALFSAEIELAVFTEAHVAGELAGPFRLASGSTEFQLPPPPAAPNTLTGPLLDRDIVRFLTQATFGPTAEEITAMQERIALHSGDRIAAYAAWIDEQFALSSPSLLQYTLAADRQEIESYAALGFDPDDAFDPLQHNRRRGWWMLARHAPDQLRQRAAFALSQIFVISEVDDLVRQRAYGAAHYYDMLGSGASGSYRDLLEGVATHPMMGHYLSHLRNSKPTLDTMGNVVISPDENFAREIMQLFSIGLVELHPDGSLKLGPNGLPLPTYRQDDITALARVFTGWSFGVRNAPVDSDTVVPNTNFNHGNGRKRFEAQWMSPMVMFADHHDAGAKQLLGLEIPAGQSGEDDLAAVIDHLAAHPNTAPFISRRLIQRLVTANPSAGYLHRVSLAFTASGGNLAATIKAILLDPEARSVEAADTIAGIGKAREPLLRHLAFLRAFDGKSQLLLSDLEAYGYPATESAKFPAGITRMRVRNTDTALSQTPLAAPSVFNWFQPDHTPAGLLAANGLVSPELQLANESSVYRAINHIQNLIYSANGQSGDPLLYVPHQVSLGYAANAHHIFIDTTPLQALYMAVVDTNLDGEFDNLDTGTFNNPEKIAEACAAVLDRIDLLLCAGALKARYGDEPGQPRRLILDALTTIRANGSGHISNQRAYMRDRIKAALWLVITSPDSLIQT